MPSPFPGVDPFLEHPLLWPTLQQYLLGHLADTLAEVLPRRYQAELRERIYRDPPESELPPRQCTVPLRQASQPHNNGTLDQRWHIALGSEEVRESFVQIALADDPAQIVTVIEVPGLESK